MSHTRDVTYKGYRLTAMAIVDGEMYSAMLIVCDPSGTRRASGTLGKFASAIGAERYALAYGMAEIDHRSAPLPD
ncbi:hypothetical protein AWB78_04469 [Caballeronia calidae]|uniref:Uncharacterized protein n=1 Tax=Caballeronia calidae TaxID=1777139 RepID=A0A158CX27_9BURK|nr:hypothetical protein [Caballeronia calidae]SAK86771.1 hypothetical protein AWB78_04469 [Caballeronia calidae]